MDSKIKEAMYCEGCAQPIDDCFCQMVDDSDECPGCDLCGPDGDDEP